MGLFSKQLGEVAVPGEATLALPKGRVKVDYDEQRKGREADESTGKAAWLGAPDGLAITITPAAGGAAVAVEPNTGHHDYSTMRRIGSRVGNVEIPTAGDYTVSVAPVPASGRELYGPVIKLKT
jgi:hypothetical protein